MRASAKWLMASAILAIAAPFTASAQQALPVAVQIDLLKQQIYAAADAKRYDEVITLMQRMRSFGPNYPLVLDMIDARASLQIGQPARAKQVMELYLKRATPVDPYYAEAISLYPTLDQAIADRKLAVAAEKTATEVLENSLNPRSPGDALPFADPSLTGQKLSPAVALARVDVFLRKYPDNPYANAARGEILARLKRASEARAAYGKSLALTGGRYRAAILSRAMLDDFQSDSARTEDLVAAVSMQPFMFLSGKVFDVIKKTPGAIEKVAAVFTAGLAKDPSLLSMLISRSVLYEQTDSYALSVVDLGLLLAKKPDEPIYYDTRCRIRAEGNIDLQGALADCDKAAVLRKVPAPPRWGRAVAYLRLGNSALARTEFEKLLAATNPSDLYLSRYRFGHGIALLKMGETAAGNAEIAAADAIGPEGRQRFHQLGLDS
ncbi:MAG: hypothetical protein ABIT09_05365 [Croceibacterium sp.]